MIDKVNLDECVICKACSNACPVDAIKFDKEYYSFYYPTIDYAKCIKCQKCENVCPALNNKTIVMSDNFPKTKCGFNSDEAIRLKSSSGGIFYELAKKIINEGGYVCGAVFDYDFTVKHIVSNSIDDVKLMMGSKYAQSDIGNVYQKTKELLDNKCKVLFTGCPCQVSGLKYFLQKDYDNLYLMDFICHGIPSSLLLKNYISLREKRSKSKLTFLNFRDKKRGWHNSSVLFEFSNGKSYSKPVTLDDYMVGFYKNVTFKESCYNCKFRNFQSGSDLTLGDLWGAEIEFKNIDDNKGMSAILINSPKGENLINSINIVVYDVSLNEILKYNKNIIESSKKGKQRTAFFDYAKVNGYERAIEKYFKESKADKLKREIIVLLRITKRFLFNQEKPLY